MKINSLFIEDNLGRKQNKQQQRGVPNKKHPSGQISRKEIKNKAKYKITPSTKK